jgi:hypothetical protein
MEAIIVHQSEVNHSAEARKAWMFCIMYVIIIDKARHSSLYGSRSGSDSARHPETYVDNLLAYDSGEPDLDMASHRRHLPDLN